MSATSSWHGEGWPEAQWGGNASAAGPEGSTPASVLGCCRTGSTLLLAGRAVMSDAERVFHCSVRIAELYPVAAGCPSSQGNCSGASSCP